MSWAPRTRWVVTACNVGIAAWGLRFLAGSELPPGNDITGHLQRTAYAIDELWANGLADGWYPGAMLGYQEFLFYGPGLTALVALVRLVSLGQLSDPGALEVVMVGAFLAVPVVVARLARALGSSVAGAAGAGVLALAAGSTRGGGIDGAFATGLAAQHVAVPLVVLSLALVIELVQRSPDDHGHRRLSLAVTLTAVALTHPLSLVLVALLVPLCLAATWLSGNLDRAAWRHLAVAATLTVGLSAWWWLPALLHADLRGPVTSFTLPGVQEHIELLVQGDRGWRGIAGPVATVGVIGALATGVVRRDRTLLSLLVLPVGGFVLLHAGHGLLGIDHELGRQLPNRGLALVAVLTAPAAAMTYERWARGIGRWLGGRAHRDTAVTASWLVLAVVAAWSLTRLEIGEIDRYRPIPAMDEAASILATEVPDWGRFAWVDGNSYGMGVPEPQRWLAWKSNRSGLAPFGPEYAPGAGSVRVALEGPGDRELDGWIDEVRRLGATHIVTADDEETAPRLLGHPRLEARLARDHLYLWRIIPTPEQPVGSIIPAQEVTGLHVDANRYVAEITREVAGDVELALGYSPGWQVTVDGRPAATQRSDRDRLEVRLPAGTQRVELTFVEPVSGPIGRGISVVSAAGALGWSWRQRRRRTRSEPVAEIGSKSPAMARR